VTSEPAGVDRPVLTRDAILAEARAMVADAGLESLSLRRLAARLGVTAPALYAHVDGKHDLLRAIAEQEFAALSARFDAVAAGDPVARMRANARAYVDHARASPELFRVMFLFPPALGPGAGAVPEGAELPAATKVFASSVDAVQAAIDDRQLDTTDSLLAALALWSAAHGVATVLQLGFDLPAELEEALIDEVTDRLLRGYQP
jgi:AcrR family transcriptional regulator